jgi:hypothetical protein
MLTWYANSKTLKSTWKLIVLLLLLVVHRLLALLLLLLLLIEHCLLLLVEHWLLLLLHVHLLLLELRLSVELWLIAPSLHLLLWLHHLSNTNTNSQI